MQMLSNEYGTLLHMTSSKEIYYVITPPYLTKTMVH